MSFRHYLVTLLALIPFSALAQSNMSNKNPPWVKNTASNQFNSLYRQQWRQAENRNSCALLVLPRDASSHLAHAKSRPAQFSGGWAIAYDTPTQRSAYGVAGTGAQVTNADMQRWPQYRFWRDGSAIGWGLEGDTGPGYLAYVKVKGQTCLYNVWSHVSETHLLSLIQDLRKAEQ